VLFSVKNTSLSDFIPSTKPELQKYVSPALRRQQQHQHQQHQHQHQQQPDRRFTSRNQFTSGRKQKKPTLVLSGAAFPSMSGDTTITKTNGDPLKCNKYAEATAMNNDDYQTQQREIASNMNDNTEYDDDDILGRSQENYMEDAEQVCPLAAASSAMSMLRVYQEKRDEQNHVFGAQSPYWNTKSLLDFDVNSDDDSNYAESSESESEEKDDY